MRRSPCALYHEGQPITEVVVKGSRTRERNPEDYLEGFAAGQGAWADRFAPLLRRLEEELVSLAEFRRELMQKLEDHIVELAVAVSRKLLFEEVDEGRHKASAMVRGILQSLDARPDSLGIRIRLHPDDHAEIVQATREDPEKFGDLAHVDFVPDGNMRQASFAIDSEFGHVLYDVESQLADIEALLTQEEGT